MFDINFLQGVVTVAIGVVTFLGVIFGWFGKVWQWISGFFKSKPTDGLINVPSKTIILIPVSRSNAFWWHMGAIGDQPVMQLVGNPPIFNRS